MSAASAACDAVIALKHSTGEVMSLQERYAQRRVFSAQVA
jgi:hypothetical protein